MLSNCSLSRLTVYSVAIALFPFFFLYQLAVSKGLPPILGGYTGLASLFSLVSIMVVASIWHYRHGFWVYLDVWAVLFIVFGLSWSYASQAYITQYGAGENVIGGLVIWLSYYLFGRAIPLFDYRIDRILLLSYLIMLFVIISNVEDGVFKLGRGEGTATYQSFGYSFLFVSCFIIMKCRSFLMAWVATLTSLVALVFNGARSEFIALSIIMVVYFGLSKNKIINIVIIATGVVFAFLNLSTLEGFEKNRFYNLIFMGAQGSLDERAVANAAGIQTVFQSPVLGDFASYPEGLFAHNAISAWVDLGALGFVWFFSLVFCCLLILIRIPRRFVEDREKRMLFSMMVAGVILLISAKYFTYPFFALVLGMVINFESSVLIKRRSSEAC